jgi:hypothetical protein
VLVSEVVGMSEDDTDRIDCPDCDWQSREFEVLSEELASKVDTAMHYVDEHDGEIPDDAPFGNDQCPECLDIHGFNGTISCSECGFIPERVRA